MERKNSWSLRQSKSFDSETISRLSSLDPSASENGDNKNENNLERYSIWHWMLSIIPIPWLSKPQIQTQLQTNSTSESHFEDSESNNSSIRQKEGWEIFKEPKFGVMLFDYYPPNEKNNFNVKENEVVIVIGSSPGLLLIKKTIKSAIIQVIVPETHVSIRQTIRSSSARVTTKITTETTPKTAAATRSHLRSMKRENSIPSLQANPKLEEEEEKKIEPKMDVTLQSKSQQKSSKGKQKQQNQSSSSFSSSSSSPPSSPSVHEKVISSSPQAPKRQSSLKNPSKTTTASPQAPKRQVSIKEPTPIVPLPIPQQQQQSSSRSNLLSSPQNKRRKSLIDRLEEKLADSQPIQQSSRVVSSLTS